MKHLQEKHSQTKKKRLSLRRIRLHTLCAVTSALNSSSSCIALLMRPQSILQPLSNKRFRKNSKTHKGKQQENLTQTHPIIIKRLPRFRPEMTARGTPEPQKLSYISQVQPQTEFSTIFDQFLPPFWEPLGTLGATLRRPWPPLDAFFGDFLQCLF